MTVLFDIETRSPVDLRSEGGRRYARHPATEILSAAWYDTETGGDGLWLPGVEGEMIRPGRPLYNMLHAHVPEGTPVHAGREVPQEILALAASSRPFVAHNAWGFDQIVWEAKTPAEAHPASWIDTDPLARACGLPGGLDKIGKTLRSQGKLVEGRDRLKKFMDYKKAPGPGDLVMIGAYCWDDTCGLLKTLWDYLAARPPHEFEKKVLAVHREVNAAGVNFDSALAYALKDLASAASRQALERCRELSGGDKSPFQTEADLRKRDKVFDWILRQGGYIGTSLRREVVENLIREFEALEDGDPDDPDDPDEGEGQEAGGEVRIPPVVVEFLKARFAVLRITKAKIDSAIQAVSGGRLYDLLVYFGAHTGRQAGRRMQIQNLPRPKETVPVWEVVDLYEWEKALEPGRVQEILDSYRAKLVAGGKREEDLVRANLDDAASALLRGVLIPDPGEVFVAGDYNAIELRGAAWVAGEKGLIETMLRREDPYCIMAEKIYGRPCTSKKDPIRQVGKVVVLGCGYQLGAVKFGAYAAASGIDLEAAGVTPQECVSSFRDLYPKIAGERTGDFTEDGQPIRTGGVWGKLNTAALHAMEDGYARVGPIRFRKKGSELHMILPAGRPIVYREAEVREVVPSWEKGKKNPKTKQAVVYLHPRGYYATLYGGKLLENAVQGLCRDLLMYAKVAVYEAGYKPRFDVHDELVASVKDSLQGRDVMRIMSTPPPWASGFPILVEADMMPRYAKTAPPGFESFKYQDGLPV